MQTQLSTFNVYIQRPLVHSALWSAHSVVLLSRHTTLSIQEDLVDEEDHSFTHPFLVLQAVQHRFPPRLLLWTSLRSCLHLPISECVLELSHSWISRLYNRPLREWREIPTQSFYVPFPLGSQMWCMNVYAKIGKTLCPSTLLHEKDNTQSLRGSNLSHTPCCSHIVSCWFLFAALGPEGLVWSEHQGREREPEITRMVLSPKTITATMEIWS